MTAQRKATGFSPFAGSFVRPDEGERIHEYEPHEGIAVRLSLQLVGGPSFEFLSVRPNGLLCAISQTFNACTNLRIIRNLKMAECASRGFPLVVTTTCAEQPCAQPMLSL